MPNDKLVIMKVLMTLVVALVATRTALAGSDSSSSTETDVDYECHMKKGQGESLKHHIAVAGIETLDKCTEACIEKKKIENRIDGVSWGIKEKSCECLKDMIRIRTAEELQENYRSCHLRRDEPNELNGVAGHEVGEGGEAVDLSYSYFKDLDCDQTWTRVGCYNVTEGDRFLLNYKCDVEWEAKRHPIFAKSLVCACAEAARLNNVQYFATHFWGECWEIDPEAIGDKSTGCKLADGTYNHNCDSIDHGGECLGVTGYYIYTNVGTESEEDRKKKRQAGQIPKRSLEKKSAEN